MSVAIHIGDQVYLRSGSPIMTVVRHGYDMANVGPMDHALLVVGWNDDTYHEAYVRPDALALTSLKPATEA